MLTDLCSSRCRIDILRLLTEDQLSGRELEDRVDYQASTVRRNTKILRDDGWVERRDGDHRIAGDRRHLVDSLLDTARLFDAFQEFEEFWESHDVEALPQGFRERMGEGLDGGEVVSGTTANPRAPLERLKGLIGEASRLDIASPAFVPEYLDMCEVCREAGTPVRFAGTGDVFRAYEETDPTVLLEHYRQGTLSLYRYDGLDVGLAVSDGFVALNLPHRDGILDLDRMFLARSDDAVAWGEELFDRYRERGEAVSLDAEG